MGIAVLSTELVQLIAQHLTEKDMAMLARTSQLFYRTLNHILYRYNARYHASSALIWGCERGVLGTVLHSLENHANVNTRLSSGQKEGDPLLYIAAENSNYEIIRTLLQEDVKVNATSTGGRTAVSIAASNGHWSAVNELLGAGADIDLADCQGKTPLSWAAECGFVAIIEQLLAAGASIEHADRYGRTPLFLAAESGQDKSVGQLLRAKADVHISDNIFRFTALSIAAFLGFRAIVDQLIKAGADVNHEIVSGATPVEFAARSGDNAMVRELLHAGSKPQGCARLTRAAEYGKIDLVKILLQAGADIGETCTDGRTALSRAAERGYIEVCRTLIHAGAEVGSADILGRTALSWAAENGNIDQFRFLWYLDAQLDQTDQFARSPLSWAAERGHNDIVAFIISQKAPLDITHKGDWVVERISDALRLRHPSAIKMFSRGILSRMPFSGAQSMRETVAALPRPPCNPLIIAVAGGHTQTVKLLLDAGAAADIEDNEGFTPLMFAARKSNADIISLLVSAGASLDKKCQRG